MQKTNKKEPNNKKPSNKKPRKREPERIPILDYVINLVDAQTSMLQIKEWFLNACRNLDKHPQLDIDDGWPYYLSHYDWLEDEGVAVPQQQEKGNKGRGSNKR